MRVFLTLTALLALSTMALAQDALQQSDTGRADQGRSGVRRRIPRKKLPAALDSERRMRAGDILYLQERLFRTSVDEELLRQRRDNLEGTTVERDRDAVRAVPDSAARPAGREPGESIPWRNGRGTRPGAGEPGTRRDGRGLRPDACTALGTAAFGGLRLFWRRIGRTLLQKIIAEAPGFLKQSGTRLWELFQRIEQKRTALSVKYALADELPTRVDGADDFEVPAGAGGKHGVEVADNPLLPDDGPARA